MIENTDYKLKRFFLIATLFFLIVPLFAKLFYLQIIDYQRYFNEADRNRIRLISIDAPRGLILDRHQQLLAVNTNSYTVQITPYSTADRKQTLRRISKILDLDSNKVLKLAKSRFTYQPIPIARNVDYTKVAIIEEHSEELAGIDIHRGHIRFYPYQSLACHTIGYLGEVTEEEMDIFNERNYGLGDLIGKCGVEAFYDSLLRGKNGYKFIEVNALEREMGEIYPEKTQLPEPGYTLHLSLDIHLQKKAEELLSQYNAGVVVIMNTKSGEILTLANYPTYDLNWFSGGISDSNWQMIQNNTFHPMFNRSISSRYPPGSVFKVVTAAAALEILGYNAHTTLQPCAGRYTYGNRSYGCWNLGGHGTLNMLEALAHSCDIYFYQLGLKLGLEGIHEYSLKMRLGQTTGIDIFGESRGIIPDESYYFDKLKWKYFPKGILLNLSIGQGEILTTPLQIAMLMSLIAERGHTYRPHLLHAYEDAISRQMIYTEKQQISCDLKDETWDVLQKALYMVVNTGFGTGGRAAVQNITVAGKTGSAENSGELTHAWFAGYAPFDQPEIAFACIVENAGHGGSIAAPIINQLLDEYFNNPFIASP